jgi:hypothetical protein
VGVLSSVRAPAAAFTLSPALAGLAIGLSLWLKTVAISRALLVPIVLVCAVPGNARRRLFTAAASAAAVIVMALTYFVAQAITTGYRGYTPLGGWNLYARVATFVDCSHFTPPKGTVFLCPAEPVGHRHNQAFFEYSPKSPAVRRFGRLTRAPGYANGMLQRFSDSAIEHEPVAYLKAILHGLTFFVSARRGEGYTPEQLRETLFDRTGNTSRPTISSYYDHARGAGSSGSVRPLVSYESHTRVQGAFLVALLLAAIIGTPLLRGRARWAAVLFTLTALLSAIFAVAGNRYDARYAYPTFGPLAAGAALGAWGIAARVRQHGGALVRRGLRPRGERVG